MTESNDLTWRNYQETVASFRALADVRFKLLALIPALSGAAVGLISFDLAAFRDTPLPRALVGLLGLMVTLGIVVYDVRNSQLYNALAKKAKALEAEMGWTKGQFSDRPERTLRFAGLVKIWHDRGLALIYGSVLGAWLFPVYCGLFWILPLSAPWGFTVPGFAGTLSLLSGAALIAELHRLDRNA